jgi:hypothetical protein
MTGKLRLGIIFMREGCHCHCSPRKCQELDLSDDLFPPPAWKDTNCIAFKIFDEQLSPFPSLSRLMRFPD